MGKREARVYEVRLVGVGKAEMNCSKNYYLHEKQTTGIDQLGAVDSG